MKPSDNIIKYTTEELINSEAYTSWVSANTDTSKNTVDDISPAPYQDGYKYTFSWSTSSNSHSGTFSLLCNDDKTEWQTSDKYPFEDISGTHTSCSYDISSKIPKIITDINNKFDPIEIIILDSNPSNYSIGETYTGENDCTFEIISIEENIITETLYEVTLYYNSEISYIPKNIFKEDKDIKTFEIHSDIITSLEDGTYSGKSNNTVFAVSGLQSLIINVENFEKFGDYSLYNCTSFTELTLYSTSIPTIGTDAFGFLVPPQTLNRTLYVPESVLEDYQNSDFADYFTTILPIPEPVPPTPPVPPFRGYGFNRTNMIDIDYLNEIGIRFNR